MMSPNIHNTAIVATSAKLGSGVIVKPYAIIEDHVEIGDHTTIGPHCVIHNYVKIGQNNRIHAHVVIGDDPQDISFDGAETWVVIGDNNILREGTTIHRSTNTQRPTQVGSNCFLMANSHVAHDCTVEDHATLINCVNLGGHVSVGERAIIGGVAQVHQFVRIGRQAMISSLVFIRKDILPFTLVGGEPVKHYRLNTVGIKRAGITGDRYKTLEQAYRLLRAGDKNLDRITETEEIKHLKTWLEQPSKRGLTGFVTSSDRGSR